MAENITKRKLVFDAEESPDKTYIVVKNIDRRIGFKKTIPIEEIKYPNSDTVYIYGLYDDSGIRYVGKTVNIEKRFKTHLTSAFDKNKREYNTFKARWVRKHKEEIRCQVLEICNSSNWEKSECFWIDVYNDMNITFNKPLLTNGTSGGDRNYNYLEAVRQKISEKRKNTKQSRETINKQIESRRKTYLVQYTKEGNFIRKWDTLKQAASELNIPSSNISKSAYTNRRTAKGFLWRVYPLTEDYKVTIESSKFKRPVLQYDLNDNFIKEWDNPKEASEAFNIGSSYLWDCLKGKYPKCHGYKWKYKNIE